MNDNEKKSGGWGMIIGGILLIVVLFGCIKFVFWGLGQVVRRDVPDASSGVSVSQDASEDASEDVSEEPDAPSFCVHCGRALPESFRWGQFCPWCGEQII